MFIKRDISSKIKRLQDQFPALILTGARQTGKTTLLRELFPNHTYVSLDIPATASLAEREPSAFLAQYPPPVLIDEVQYAPALFRNLKSVIDSDRDQNGRFILTGSQKFTLMKEVSESLAGRCALLELETLSMQELGTDGQEYRRLHPPGSILVRGMYPQLWKDRTLHSEDFYSAYFATYIERDVRQILHVTSLRDFDRFVRACAARSGQLLNKADVARDVRVNSSTVGEWLSVLEASKQITLLEPYFANISKRLTKSPKLYFNDTGLLCFLLGLGEESVFSSPSIGAIWETFVFSELRKSLLHTPRASCFFYRDRTQEVDFLINVDGGVDLLECKWTEQPDQSDGKSIKKVREILSGERKAIEVGRQGANLVVCRAPHTYPLESEPQNSSRSPLRAISGFELHRR